METLFESFARSLMPDNRIMTLAAIHLSDYVVIGTGELKYRLEQGMEIRVQNGEIVNCSEHFGPTHRIAGCIGTLSSSHLEFILMNLKTGESENLIVK